MKVIEDINMAYSKFGKVEKTTTMCIKNAMSERLESVKQIEAAAKEFLKYIK